MTTTPKSQKHAVISISLMASTAPGVSHPPSAQVPLKAYHIAKAKVKEWEIDFAYDEDM